MWKTTNGLGQPVTWYSENEYKKVEEVLTDIKDIAIDGYYFYSDIDEKEEREWFEEILQKINEVLQWDTLY